MKEMTPEDACRLVDGWLANPSDIQTAIPWIARLDEKDYEKRREQLALYGGLNQDQLDEKKNKWRPLREGRSYSWETGILRAIAALLLFFGILCLLTAFFFNQDIRYQWAYGEYLTIMFAGGAILTCFGGGLLLASKRR